MKVQNVEIDTFASAVKGQSQKIVLYGAGVIGKVVLPYFIEEKQLEEDILFVADGDPRKHGDFVKIGEKDIPICSPEKLEQVKEKFAILITGSRYEGILRYLEQMEFLSGTDVYIFPQMLVKKCRLFPKQEIRRVSEHPLIPKTIHYCWFGGGEMPEVWKRYQESWKRFCPDYQIVEWNEKNYQVEDRKFTSQAYRHKKWSFVSDMARLDILYKYGGIYLDTDVELTRPLDDLLYQPGFVGVEKWGVVNSGGGCGAVPGHPIIGEILEERLRVPFEYEDGSLNLESSGYYESKPLLSHGFKPNNTVQVIDGMTVYSSEFFHPFDYMSKELCITDNTYGIHHFTGSWL